MRHNKYALDAGHVQLSSGNPNTLATIGKNGDIVVAGSNISRVQCSFEINPDSKVIMFYDRSHCKTSQVFGKGSVPFEECRPRKVVVQPDLNTIIGRGGAGQDLVQFKLEWHCLPSEVAEKVECREDALLENDSFLAPTASETDGTPSSPRKEQQYRQETQQFKLRRYKANKISGGRFASVFKAVDIDSRSLNVAQIYRQTPVTDWQIY